MSFSNFKSSSLLFSSAFLFFAFFVKPFFDAIYFLVFAKYLYFILFVAAGLVSVFGLKLSSTLRGNLFARDGVGVFCFLLFLYIVFLARLAYFNGGDFDDLIRKVMPFVSGLFLLTLPAYSPVKKYAVIICSVIIIANILVIPFSWSWIYWGGVHTFRGLYYFKTDLAFTVVLAFLLAFYARGCIVDKYFYVGALLVSIMVVLSNSRMNYLLVAVVFAYCAVVRGVSIKTMLNLVLGTLIFGGVLFFLYDSDAALGFDFYNMNKFTQGRNHIWDALIDVGFYKADYWEILFGHGLDADWKISYLHGGLDQVHDAHNEILHLLINQGVFGFFLYLLLWIYMAKSFGWVGFNNNSKVFVGVVVLLFFVQGMTAVFSSYYLKTWWMLFAIVLASNVSFLSQNKDNTFEVSGYA